MKPTPLAIFAGLISLAAGCSTTQLSRAPIRADTPFTLTVVKYSVVGAPAPATATAAARLSPSRAAPAGNRYAIVRCVVDVDGTNRNLQCVESSDPAVAQAAMTVVSRGRFVTVKRASQTVPVNVDYRVVFYPDERAHPVYGRDPARFRSHDRTVPELQPLLPQRGQRFRRHRQHRHQVSGRRARAGAAVIRPRPQERRLTRQV